VGNTPICLTIAGSDSCAGAGIQADIKTFSVHQCYAMSVITASTAQSHQGIVDVAELSPDHIRAQLSTLLDTYNIAAIKTGMIASPEQVNVIAEILNQHPDIPLVVDPVLGSSSGKTWSSNELIDSYLDHLLPRANLITPNKPEAIAIFGEQVINDPHTVLRDIASKNNLAILLKGGHETSSVEVTDYLYTKESIKAFSHPRVCTTNDHGTGCTLASAISANLAHGKDIEQATKNATQYVHSLLSASKGFLVENSNKPLSNLPMNHFFEE
jgi:hydroxymethylpyrimidine/phosphomethylpyrimidine kinase